MAWAVASIVAAGMLSASLATAISAGAASFLIVIASRVTLLSVVPATFYGFASTFAYLSLAPGAFTLAALTSLGWKNAIVNVPISLLLGTGLGVAHSRLAEMLAADSSAATPQRTLSRSDQATTHSDSRVR
jgi:hypothetical protein